VWLQIDANIPTKIMVPIHISNSNNQRMGYQEQTITAYELLQRHVDLQGKATASALRTMLPFAGSMELRNFGRRLTNVNSTIDSETLSSSASSSPFKEWLGQRYLTKLDLAILWECRPSLQAFARIVGAMQPRLYSIATTTNSDVNHTVIGICLSVAQGGLTSTYLSQILQLGSPVTVFVRPSKFHFSVVGDDDGGEASSELLFIGAGSGVGPYLGFLEQYQQQKELQQSKVHDKNETKDVNTIFRLILGSRHPNEILYRHRFESLREWSERSSCANVTIRHAFSRLQGHPKQYVQDVVVLPDESIVVWEKILQNNGKIYACGRMEICTSIVESLIQVARKIGGLDATSAKALIDEMQSTGRLLTDCWSVDHPPNLQLPSQQCHFGEDMIETVTWDSFPDIPSPSIVPGAVISQREDLSHIPAWPSYLRMVASGEFERR
jgi:sulfite reductase alpha subunit-like flavoprotein